jgi:hypothetical protein
MRTTLTLDPDVAARIERLRAERQDSLKELVNEALRLGLRQIEEPPASDRAPYQTPADSLGGCRLPSLDDVADALALGEGEGFR